MDEQCRHQRVGGVGLEDLHPEAVGTGERRGEGPVLDDRAGARRRRDVEGDLAPLVAGDRGAPTLDPLGQRVVGALLGHERVGDAGVGVGGVGATEQPAAGGPAQGATERLGGRRAVGVGACGLLDRVARNDEDVGRCGQEAQRRVRTGLDEPGREGVGRHRDAHVGATVGVEVVAQQQAPVEPGQPVGDGRDLGEQVDPGPPDEAVRGPGRRRHEQPAGPAPGRRQHPLPDGRDGQVDRRHGRAPAQQRAERSHLGAGAEDGDGAPVQPEPLRVGRDRPHRVGGGRLDHAATDPLVELAAQVAADQPTAAVGQGELADPLPVTTDLDGVEGPGGRGVGQRRRADGPLPRRSPPPSGRARTRVPPSATDRHASGVATPASTSRRKCRR